MSWAGHVARMEKTNIHRILVAKYEGTILCGRPRRRWEDNIKMDLTEMCWGVNWIYVAEHKDTWADVSTAMNLWVP